MKPVTRGESLAGHLPNILYKEGFKYVHQQKFKRDVLNGLHFSDFDIFEFFLVSWLAEFRKLFVLSYFCMIILNVNLFKILTASEKYEYYSVLSRHVRYLGVVFFSVYSLSLYY
jgi:hypothetical protein